MMRTASKTTASFSDEKKRKSRLRCQRGREVGEALAMRWTDIFREKCGTFNARVSVAQASCLWGQRASRPVLHHTGKMPVPRPATPARSGKLPDERQRKPHRRRPAISHQQKAG